MSIAFSCDIALSGELAYALPSSFDRITYYLYAQRLSFVGAFMPTHLKPLYGVNSHRTNKSNTTFKGQYELEFDYQITRRQKTKNNK